MASFPNISIHCMWGQDESVQYIAINHDALCKPRSCGVTAIGFCGCKDLPSYLIILVILVYNKAKKSFGLHA